MATQSHLVSDAAHPRRVLIVRIGAMGDVLHALPAVSAMRRQHPDWHIGWAIEPIWIPLLRADSGDSAEPGSSAMPLVDRIHSVPTRTWKRRPFAGETIREIKALRREFRAERYDLCVDMQSAIRSAVVGRLSGAPEVAGPAVPHEKPANWLYGKSVPTPGIHVVEQGYELLSGAIGEALRPTEDLLPIDDCAERWRDDLLARTLPAASRHYAIVAPSAGWGAKQWPAERYGAVAAELACAGYTPLINATSTDDQLANAVAEASEGTATVVPCTVSQLISLTRRASLVIAGDTGPLHLAASLQRPVVALFGPTDPARNGPWGTRARILRHPSSRRDHSRHADTEEGLLQITIDEVNTAALELLSTEHDKVIL